ncbi:MAG: GDP-mannose 4,6-dehydratase [Ktedonobacteraceae bacterium]|nr:GDP-mannose 4,6-dehydratase [Ktedonobacteraceae bacterium]
MSIPSRILITGCTGFVGGYLLELCRIRYPHAELFGVTARSTVPMAAPPMSDVQLIVADITQPEDMRQGVVRAQPDLIIHLAAQSSVAASWQDPAETLRVNAGGAIQLLEAVRSAHLMPRIVLVGSGEQYGMVRPEDNPIREDCPFRPANPYAVSKVAQDLYGYQYFVAYSLPILRVRPFNHFGPRQAATFVVANFARQIALIEARKAEPVLSVGNLQARRDFLPVEDVVAAYLAVAEQGQPGEAYNIGSGQARSIGAILDLLLTFAKAPIQLREDPARLRPVDVPLLEADTSRLRADTNWQPSVPFEVALQRTLDYWRTVVSAEAG